MSEVKLTELPAAQRAAVIGLSREWGPGFNWAMLRDVVVAAHPSYEPKVIRPDGTIEKVETINDNVEGGR